MLNQANGAPLAMQPVSAGSVCSSESIQRATLTKTYTPDQWVDVAIGAALLENDAVLDTAIARSAGHSVDRLTHLETFANAAHPVEQPPLQTLLQTLRAKVVRNATVTKPQESWFSRLFRKQ